MGFNCVEEIRAWQAAYAFKLAVYKLIRTTSIARDFALRDQLRNAVASAVSQIEEGYARFYPKDFGRLVVGAKASLAEARGHLRDAVDVGHITEASRVEHDQLAQKVLPEMAGLLDYLQSPEAEANAQRIKAKRAERRAERRRQNHRTNHERRTTNKNPEPGIRNPEPENH
jgi:four helix bundle protein